MPSAPPGISPIPTAPTVSSLATPQGGLCMIYGLYPGVPLKNVAALMDAMERYMFYYS